MVVYDEQIKKNNKHDTHENLFFILFYFSVDLEGSGGHLGRSRTDSGAKHVLKNEISKN